MLLHLHWVGNTRKELKKKGLGISQHPCEQIATVISRGTDNDRLSQLRKKHCSGGDEGLSQERGSVPGENEAQ